ncbi:MAG TPA: hypothetical protein DEQ32_05580 [Gammaproteobacteria bacterium]|mgnify:CR=1 FL=1|nr:hypothetical protein [Gammaproteobacteria bacterium]|tara:strand:+ start:3920 stop:4774 length:855 start_codon:yes stop_codon:yes gene_type:complete
MDKIIGIGNFGCKVAEEFSQHPEYRIYKIAPDLEERGAFCLDPQPDMQTYEEAVPTADIENYFRSIRAGDEVLAIIEGGDPVSGTVLKILSTIKDASLHLMYICPDRQMISQVQKRDDRIAFNVLQEYARSGMLSKMFFVDRPMIEELVGDVAIHEHEQKVAHFISYIFAMINFYKHTDAIVSQEILPVDWCRLAVLGLTGLEEDRQQLQLMFPLSQIKDIHFFYGIPQGDLEEDATLIKRIKKHVRSHSADKTSTSFSVYSTTFDQTLVLCAAYTDQIQAFRA